MHDGCTTVHDNMMITHALHCCMYLAGLRVKVAGSLTSPVRETGKAFFLFLLRQGAQVHKERRGSSRTQHASHTTCTAATNAFRIKR